MLKKTKLFFSGILKKSENPYYTIVLTALIMLTLAAPAYAGDPKIITGTKLLFEAVTKWLLLIIPVAAGAVLGYQALQKSLSDDHAVVAEKNKMMKNVIIGAAIAETAAGLVTTLLAFYA